MGAASQLSQSIALIGHEVTLSLARTAPRARASRRAGHVRRRHDPDHRRQRADRPGDHRDRVIDPMAADPHRSRAASLPASAALPAARPRGRPPRRVAGGPASTRCCAASSSRAEPAPLQRARAAADRAARDHRRRRGPARLRTASPGGREGLAGLARALDETAFVVSVAQPHRHHRRRPRHMNEQVFTNIDSAVIALGATTPTPDHPARRSRTSLEEAAAHERSRNPR